MQPQHFVAGQWQFGEGGRFDSRNPADGSVLWSGDAADANLVNAAFDSARQSLPAWRALSVEDRWQRISRFGEILKDNELALTRLISEETGKPLWDSAGEVKAMIGKIALSYSAYFERTGSRTEQQADGRTVLRHRPHGVVAIFGPYNFPAHLPNGHIVPALLAGNTVVLKPSELTPAVATFVQTLWQRAEVPDGVLNLIHGKAETGKLVAAHPALDGLFFTGSARTGQLIHRQFAGYPGKILALEMGGNNPLVVSHVGSLEGAVYQTLLSAYISSGQRCTCARRLFVRDSDEGDAFVAALVRATAKLTVDRFDAEPQPFMGPLINEATAHGLMAAQEALLRIGGRDLLPMRQDSQHPAFLTSGIIDMTEATNIPDEELFGPLVQLYRYSRLNDAFEAANHTRFGLSAGFLGDDAEEFDRFRAVVTAGIVNWNRPTTGASSALPFGGTGQSGNHRPSAWYAADYCAYPVASSEADTASIPETLAPGVAL